MKKLLTSALAVGWLMSTIGSIPVSAAAIPVKITGVVSFQNQPLAGLSVLVECWQTGYSARPITSPSGLYSVNVTETECPLGSQLKVRAETADKVAFRYAAVRSFTVVDLRMVSKVPVPEHGLLGGIAALGGGIMGARFIRRYHLRKRSS